MFHNCESESEIKSLYRKLAMKLHPDYGGSHELMVLLTETYELALEFINSRKTRGNSKEEKTKKSSNSQKRKYDNVFENVLYDEPKIQIIYEILEYARKNKNFNCNFINSLKDDLDERGYLTSSQYNRLVHIYFSFHLDKQKDTK